MKTAIINIKTEPQVKTRAQKIADEMGLALGSLINGFLHNLIKTRRMEFTAYSYEEPSNFMIKSLKEAGEDEQKNRVSPVFKNSDDALVWLDKKSKKYAD